jgi:hypothetical protein
MRLFLDASYADQIGTCLAEMSYQSGWVENTFVGGHYNDYTLFSYFVYSIFIIWKLLYIFLYIRVISLIS